jgi:Fe2+ or Zn2+ uptake regulation protein
MNKLEEKLTQMGCTITKPRLVVLEYLSSHHSPISARDLHKKIKVFDQASIYRTLNLFEELHIVNVETVEKEKLYCFAEKPHHHIICTKCNYTESTKCNHDFGTFRNFNNVYHQLTLTGVCNKCSK